MSDKVKNKLIYFACLLGMISVLVGIAYGAFMREVDVDVMKNADFVYTGENGNATLKVKNSGTNINQRTADFMSTVEYQVTPNSDLSNGDSVQVSATYDKSVARQYNFHPVHTKMRVKVSGLDDQYQALKDIDKNYLHDIYRSADNYIQENEETIYQVEVNEDASRPRLDSQDIVYRAFLKSKQTKTSDRILEIYKLTYTYNKKKSVIYYVVMVTEINTGKNVDPQNIYGEKANLTQDEMDNSNFDQYVSRVYSATYDIEKIK